jgi:8-oxo-dGTP pyrophosphatase MutT (NUDIX family)
VGPLWGGAAEQNEAAEEAVRREVYEELHLEVGIPPSLDDGTLQRFFSTAGHIFIF